VFQEGLNSGAIRSFYVQDERYAAGAGRAGVACVSFAQRISPCAARLSQFRTAYQLTNHPHNQHIPNTMPQAQERLVSEFHNIPTNNTPTKPTHPKRHVAGTGYCICGRRVSRRFFQASTCSPQLVYCAKLKQSPRDAPPTDAIACDRNMAFGMCWFCGCVVSWYVVEF
jgi:hypothetical protein